MTTDFCEDIDIGQKIFKCVSLKDKSVFILMNIYFLENDFEKGDKITYFLDKKLRYGNITSIQDDDISVKDDITKTIISLPRLMINKINQLHNIFIKIQQNVEESNDLFENITKDEINFLKEKINMDKEDIIDFLLPEINEGYSLSFIFDETFYEDDTNKTVLMKISQKCSSSNFESSKYIYASYLDEKNITHAIGFNYDNKKLLSPNDILSIDLCDLLKHEEQHTDSEENNIIQHNNNFLELFGNNKIYNNTIYFISLNDFAETSSLNYLLNRDEINCDDINFKMKPLKNRIINKYWPELIREEIKNIISNNETKTFEYQNEKNKLKEYNFTNKVIYKDFNQIDSKLCDNIEVSYFKLNKKEKIKNNIDIYKLFSEFTLSEIVPFMKWTGGSYESKYFKIFKNSMVYEGYDVLRSKEKTIDIHLCQEWTKDFYRSERPLLEDFSSVNNLHKTDVLFLKVCSYGNQLIYGTLALHINGDIEFIIKKNKNDILNITSKKEIKNLIKLCNSIIKTINEKNIYSEKNIINFGSDKEINEIFEKEKDNNIQFLDFNIYYDNNNYEVKNGVKQKDYDSLKKKPSFDPLKPPFLLGDRTGLALPLIKKIIKNLPHFFRKIDEVEKDGAVLFHYKKVNDYANRNTLQSTINCYSKILDTEVSEEIINKINRDFNGDFSKEEIIQEYESWQSINKKDKFKITLNNIIDENGADIMITNTPSSIVFSINGLKSFPEFQRILYLIKTIMNLFNKYINQDKLLDDNYIKQYFENTLNIEEINIERVLPKSKNIQNLLDDSSEDEDEDEDDSSEVLPSSDESDMSGGGGKYDARSYYLKRLKKNDKKLFNFKSDKFQIDKHGNKTNTRYGYPKLCQGAKGLGSRQPISVTKEELERINNSDKEIGSGLDSYSGAIQVPGREEVDGKEIFYICPQYWDISKDLPIKSEYIDENYTKEDIIPEVLPKDGRSDKFILERKGTYWDGVPREMSHKYIVPGLLDNIIHPDGYPLPCCFSLAKGSSKKLKTIDEKLKEHFQQFEHIEIKEKEEKKEKQEKQEKKKPIKNKEICPKINTKSIGPLEKGKCSQLPIKLQKMLSQDLIFKYDPDLNVSNGLIRIGVDQNKGKTIFTVHSFINSYIEIINYKKSPNDFIEEEIIQKLENNIKIFQKCSHIQKLFKKSTITKNDDISYIKYILKKENNSSLMSKKITRNIEAKIDELEGKDIYFSNNEENYFFHLILTLKNYRDFLISSEEKKDDYLIPILNEIADYKMNIIIFEKIEDFINIKETEYNDSDLFCFILKESHYYEPILYKVHLDNNVKFIKQFSKEIFSTFNFFNIDNFINHIKTPYPRGRKKELRSGNKDSNIKIHCDDNYCKKWLTFDEYIQNFDKPQKGIEIKWNSNKDKKCENDGEKSYGTIKKLDFKNNIIIADKLIDSEEKIQVKVDFSDVLIKSEEEIIDPELKEGISQSDNWVWIGGNCIDIDRDIESLIRKQEDPKGDKLLLKLSNKSKPEIKKMKYALEKAIQTNFYLINKIINDFQKIISLNNKKIDVSKYNKDGFVIKNCIINNYSEASYLIAKKKDENDRIIPIEPTKISSIKNYKDNKYIYSTDVFINFDNLLSYLKLYKLDIDKLIVNKENLITCAIFKNVKTYIPINPIKINDNHYENYDIIESDYNPLTIDLNVYNNGNGDNKKTKYIEEYNNKNNYKKVLFNHLLNMINDKFIIIDGIPRANALDKNIGDYLYFYKKGKELIYITKDEYYYLEHSIFKNISTGQNIGNNPIPYYGFITEIKGVKTFIKCTLDDYITNIIKDEITINNYKINKIKTLLYSEKELQNKLSIRKIDIFKEIDNDYDLSNDIIEYTIDGKQIINPTFKEKTISDKLVLIKTKDIENNYDKNLITNFINKLIINVNNGKEIRFMNKLVDDIIKISDLEKNTPDSEAFYKYSKDKDTMYDILQTIYTKKSDFINFVKDTEQEKSKRVYTNKLDNIPYYINKLFGYNSMNIFSIDNKGNDWYTFKSALSQLGITINTRDYLIDKKYKYYDPLIKIILNSLMNMNDPLVIKDIISEYNKFNIMRYGKGFEKYKTKEDIINYWLSSKNKRINIPDIKLILNEIKEKTNRDLGVLIISFNGRGKNYIQYFSTHEKYHNDTPVILLQHIKYNDDYILSNISKKGRLSQQINELYDLNEDHKIWIKEENIILRECIDKSQKISIEENGISESKEEIEYQKEKISEHLENIEKIKEGECE